MPANLTPEYKNAEAAYRAATDPHDRLTFLKDMLRTIPKHKGTEHLRADIKTRIKDLTEEVTTARKSGTRGGPATVIRPEGAGQIALEVERCAAGKASCYLVPHAGGDVHNPQDILEAIKEAAK